MCLPQISFTGILLAELLHACEIQFHRRGAAKNRYRDFQPAVVVVDLFHASIEIRKRPVHDAHLPASLNGDGDVAEPTKPVTRGVERTVCQVFSSRSISTRTYPG